MQTTITNPFTPNTGWGARWMIPMGEHAVLMRPAAEMLFVLNPTARMIWETLARTGIDAACVEELVEAYGIDHATARADVAATISQWRDAGLLGDAAVEEFPHDLPPSLPADVEWTRYTLHGVTAAIANTHKALWEDLSPRIAHLKSHGLEPSAHYTAAPEKEGWAVYRDEALLQRVETVYAARTVLLADFLKLAHGRPWCASLHAAVIANACGCVVAAGASGAGKSTLCVAAMLAGLQCLGDDSAPVLQESGRIAAAPIGIMLREGSWGLFDTLPEGHGLSPVHVRDTGRVRYLSPSAAATPQVQPPKALVFLQRQSGAAPSLNEMDVIEVLHDLSETGFWVRPERDAVARFLDWLQVVPAYRMTYDTPEEGVALVRGLLEQ